MVTLFQPVVYLIGQVFIPMSFDQHTQNVYCRNGQNENQSLKISVRADPLPQKRAT